ncbi:MAG: carboxypeptidase M32 [Anaerolineaceae bacterium]|nr:carboxypeptidase M32 [Anaerolineaceae bacterium]
MSFEENLGKLRAAYKELNELSGIMSLLSWDQQVYMPKDGIEVRANQMALLGGLMHEKATSDELGKIISELASQIPDLDADDDLAREIKLAKKDYDHEHKIPKELVMERSILEAQAHSAWVEAKHSNNYPMFEPLLKKTVELNLRTVEFFKPYDHPYDILLDQFEPGMKKAEVQAIFEALRPRQIELLQKIAASPQVDDRPFRNQFPIEPQKRLGEFISRRMGLPPSRTRLDETEHPFTTEFGRDDVRITTHYYTDQVLAALLSTLHEGGHALYELGLKKAWSGTALGQATSLGVHESQSRFWENMIGRSQPFWEFFHPMMQLEFPAQLEHVSSTEAWRAANKVEPSFIRIESDEVSYNMHIMLRMELELAMIEGRLDTKDLPEAWNAKMKEYLGVVPPTDTLGCLQDVHWSGGMFGYFPTYALGNLISAQWWDKMQKDIPHTEEQILRGKFDEILAWLVKNVHSMSRRYDTQDLLQRVTGERLNPDYYINYLKEKYAQIYSF